MSLNVLLICTYEMGRQPFGLASPAAWLRNAGNQVQCLDLSVEPFREELVRSAHLVAVYVPMHMATRMAMPVMARVREINPAAHLCCFGLYASENAPYLRSLGADTILGGEFEQGLVNLANRLSNAGQQRWMSPTQPEPLVSRARQKFLVPDRTRLPDLKRYARLVMGDGRSLTVGYVEASRGCKHLCRHCPVVPVYNGRFHVIQPEVVLADIRQQVAAGAQHITFGDPDFFNGIGHAIPLVTALHAEHPHLTYDVTIKVEHLLKHHAHLPTLKNTNCLFVTTAVEAFDDGILTTFEKHHTQADLEVLVRRCRSVGLLLIPTFVAFTPWTTLAGYRFFLSEIVRLDLLDQVSPIQYTIRLLIPPGSKLLDLPEIQELVEDLDRPKLAYPWRHPEPQVDALQKDLERIVQTGTAEKRPRREVFRRIWERAHRETSGPSALRPVPEPPSGARPVPYLTEPWYC